MKKNNRILKHILRQILIKFIIEIPDKVKSVAGVKYIYAHSTFGVINKNLVRNKFGKIIPNQTNDNVVPNPCSWYHQNMIPKTHD